METNNSNPNESRGWEIVKALNDGIPSIGGLEARKLLAEYVRLQTRKPSRLHSAILSCAVKMALVFPEFHFVPFLNIWSLANLRPEDSEARTDDSGKRFPSLVERMVKAYAYSLLFHPKEHLSAQEEQMLIPTLKAKGYNTSNVPDIPYGNSSDSPLCNITTSAIATKVFSTEVRNRKMFFVQLLLPDGNEMVTEVHTLTTFQRMRYEDIEGRLFDVILRSSENGKQRVEAAVLSTRSIADAFPTCVGYVDHIDPGHHHIHIFDNLSRHLVSPFKTTAITQGQYVRFVPVIPKQGNFKTAIITDILSDGPEAFGFRDVVVTYTNTEQGYCAWELTADADGQVRPIVEHGAPTPSEPATKGYLNKALCDRKGCSLPSKDSRLQIITFLKRGKDGKKRPFVVEYRNRP